MKMRTLALLLLAAAGLAALPAACGVKVTEKATPAATPTKAARPSAAASASPSSTGAATPSPSVTLLPTPTPSTEAATARRAAASVAVKAILPRFDAQAQDIFTRSRAPGAAVAVVAGDGAVYVRCFGVREVGKPEKVDKDSVFQLASISKSFTTTMLAALVTEREIDWDDPVEKYWPGFVLWDPWVSRHVTFRDLTAHRSGLPAYAGDELEAFGYGRMEILRRLRYLEPVAGFRAAYAYQNALPTAAAEGASRATGESWERLVRTRVLAPLGMDATVLSYRDYRDAPSRSGSQTMGNGTMRAGTPADDDVFAPAGGVSATIADMVPYLRMQLNGGALAGGRVAGDKALAATHAATTVIDDDDEAGPTAYALGWETYGYLGRRVGRGQGLVSRHTHAGERPPVQLHAQVRHHVGDGRTHAPRGGEDVVVRRCSCPHRAVAHRLRPRAVGRVEVVPVAEDGRVHAKRRQHARAHESLPRLTRGPRGALGGGGRQGVLVGVGRTEAGDRLQVPEPAQDLHAAVAELLELVAGV